MTTIGETPAGADPGLDELQQHEATPLPFDPIPVDVAGPVRVHQLPARHTSYRRISVGRDPVKLAGHDPRRRILRVIAVTQDIYLGSAPEELSNTGGALIPVATWLELTGESAVWASTQDATTTDVSTIQELWSD